MSGQSGSEAHVSTTCSVRLRPRVLQGIGQRLQRAIVCSTLVAGGAAGLYFGTGAWTADRAVVRALPALAGVWGAPSTGQTRLAGNGSRLQGGGAAAIVPVGFGPRRSSANPADSGTISGDEGFWLSTHALAGSARNALAVGDHMTMAGVNYVVTALRPLVGISGDAGSDLGDKAAPGLTLVVAEEVVAAAFAADLQAPVPHAAPAAQETRSLRFLIDTVPAPLTMPPAHAAIEQPHGTL